MLQWKNDLFSIYKSRKIEIHLLMTALVCLFISIVLILKSDNSKAESENIIYEDNTLGKSKMISVDVSGAVKKPDVYIIPEGTRLKTIIQIAGGLKEDADFFIIEKQFNFSSILEDEQKIYLPYKNGDQQDLNESTNNVVSINNAVRSDIMTLEGVGDITAEKIISNRPYANLKELVEKKVIGKALFDKIKDRIEL